MRALEGRSAIGMIDFQKPSKRSVLVKRNIVVNVEKDDKELLTSAVLPHIRAFLLFSCGPAYWTSEMYGVIAFSAISDGYFQSFAV